jgi:rubrerythrin
VALTAFPGLNAEIKELFTKRRQKLRLSGFGIPARRNLAKGLIEMGATFRDLIQKAIAIEAKMAEFYGKMAEEATNPEAREVFKILAGEEEEHRDSLENYAKKGVFPQIPRIEESDLEPTLKVVASITPDMAPADALAFAIRSEEYQYKFYKKLSEEYPPGWTQNFLKRLADMELVHKEKVAKLHRWFSRVHEQLIPNP